LQIKSTILSLFRAILGVQSDVVPKIRQTGWSVVGNQLKLGYSYLKHQMPKELKAPNT